MFALKTKAICYCVAFKDICKKLNLSYQALYVYKVIDLMKQYATTNTTYYTNYLKVCDQVWIKFHCLQLSQYYCIVYAQMQFREYYGGLFQKD